MMLNMLSGRSGFVAVQSDILPSLADSHCRSSPHGVLDAEFMGLVSRIVLGFVKSRDKGSETFPIESLVVSDEDDLECDELKSDCDCDDCPRLSGHACSAATYVPAGAAKASTASEAAVAQTASLSESLTGRWRRSTNSSVLRERCRHSSTRSSRLRATGGLGSRCRSYAMETARQACMRCAFWDGLWFCQCCGILGLCVV